jgi:hypothetical protein
MASPGTFTIDPTTASTTTRHGIPYVMMRADSPADTLYIEEYTPQNVNGSFVSIVAWYDAANFVLDMLGEHRQNSTGGIARFNPEAHPYIDNLYCVGCKTIANYGVHGYSAPNNFAIEYEYVAYACTFAAFLYDVLEDQDVSYGLMGLEINRYVERRGKNIGQSLSTQGAFEYCRDANGNLVAWLNPGGGSTQAIPTPPALMVPYREMTYTWRYVPGPLATLIDRSQALYGTLNNDYFDPDWCGTTYPPGTVMYLGMEEEPIIATPAGNTGKDRLYTVPHKFAANLNGPAAVFGQDGMTLVPGTGPGWNSVYRPNLGAPPGCWDQARNRANGGPPYALNDFTQLYMLS